jgi:nitroimidazol reductase NimA-like FMN-containing flavoprotein (pyridoxamine 5'-phosphate oxidase superfamily)
MSRDQIDAFLAAPRHAIVAALRPDGTSQLSPVWYVFEESRFYFSTLVESARFVSIYGKADILEEESAWRDALEWRIMRRYHDSDEAARRYEAELAGQGRSVLVIVSPEQIMGWDYN